jgi:hypothetical protein
MRKRIEICEELNKKASIYEFKTYRNTRDFLFKTFVADNIRDTTTINWYTTTSNTIRTIVVIHVRFFVIIVVYHVARVARKLISFRNDQNLNAFFCRSAWDSNDDDEKWIDANKTHKNKKARKNKKIERKHIDINLNFFLNAILLMSVEIASKQLRLRTIVFF